MENKKTLIDGYALAKKMFYVETNQGGRGWVISLEDLGKAPTVDAVEVVRCKECKYYRAGKHFDDVKFCFRLKDKWGFEVGYNFSGDDFCSRGERRAE